MLKEEPKKEKEPVSEKEKLGEKVIEELYEEKREELEKRELLSEEEKIIREKLEREIKLMKLSPKLRDEATKKAQQIKDLDVKGKIKQLLLLAEEKGVAFAVSVVKGLNDPYLLDTFHDILARDELYKKFEK